MNTSSEELSHIPGSSLEQVIHFVPSVEPTLLGEQLLSVFSQFQSKSLVVTDVGSPIGFLSYRRVTDLLSTQFGYAVYQKRTNNGINAARFSFHRRSVLNDRNC